MKYILFLIACLVNLWSNILVSYAVYTVAMHGSWRMYIPAIFGDILLIAGSIFGLYKLYQLIFK